MLRLAAIGIPTHFVRRLNMREQLIKEVEIIPLEVVVRNVVAGSLAKRFGMEEGSPLPRSIVEYYYKSDELADPTLRPLGAAPILARAEVLERREPRDSEAHVVLEASESRRRSDEVGPGRPGVIVGQRERQLASDEGNGPARRRRVVHEGGARAPGSDTQHACLPAGHIDAGLMWRPS